jgi:site-specific recombinase XerD
MPASEPEPAGANARIEKRVHPHGFRHAWAVSQVESGTSLPVIQQLVGHSSLATSDVPAPRGT